MSQVDPRDRLTRLYAEHWRALFVYALRRCDSADAAADVVSEVFLVAWRRIGEVPPHPEDRLWLYGVARLTLGNYLRGRRRQDRLGARLVAVMTVELGEDPADLFQTSEHHRRVRTALAALSESDRELLTLVSWEELTPAEAADFLGISAVAARSRLFRARRRVAAALATADSPPPHSFQRIGLGRSDT